MQPACSSCKMSGSPAGAVAAEFRPPGMTASSAPLVAPWRIAREYSRRAREAARALDHPLSLAYVLTMSAAVAQGLDDVEATHEFASEATALSARNAFAYWRGWGATRETGA